MRAGELIEESLGVISELETGDGGYRASLSEEYKDVWPNDVMYMAMAREAVGDMASVEMSYDFLFSRFLENRERLVVDENNIPDGMHLFPSKYKLGTLEPEEKWGHNQLDVLGLFDYNVARLKANGLNLITNGERMSLMKDIFGYCIAVKCFERGDNGRWEEWEEHHSSSIGALLAGLRELKKDRDFDYMEITDEFLEFGERQMYKILPRESPVNTHADYRFDKRCDAAQLSLIWPFNIIDRGMEDTILGNVENNLVRERGVIRYGNDNYYGEAGLEARWPKFFGDLSLCYIMRGERDKALHNLNRFIACLVEDSQGRYVVPEAYQWKDSELVPNPNTPLGWGQAVLVINLVEYIKRFGEPEIFLSSAPIISMAGNRTTP
jgi:GH15 family glucan-1,4-alpha-glucosidase